MELNQLRYFTAVAEALSFTEAAERLHVSQPALSYQVKQLENELGARLFDRTSRKVSLTVDGRTFLPLARAVLLKVDEATRVMDERLGVETGQVTFGSIPSIGAYVVPHILASFRRNFPGIEVLLVEDGALALERKLLDGEIDFAIVTEPASPEALDVTPLMTEELLLVVPLHHPLAERESVALAELTQENFVLLGGSFTLGTLVVDLCRRAGFEPKVAYQAGSLETVKSFVRHDLGIAVLPRLAMLWPPEDSIVAIPFAVPLSRAITLVRAKGRYATVASRALMVHVRTTILSTFVKEGRPTPPASPEAPSAPDAVAPPAAPAPR